MPTRKALRSKKKRDLKAQRAKSQAESQAQSDANGEAAKSEVGVNISDEDLDAVVECASASDKLTAKTLAKAAPSVANAIRDGSLDKESFSLRVAEAVMSRRLRDDQLQGVQAPRGTLESALCGPAATMVEEELEAVKLKVFSAAMHLNAGVDFTNKRCWECDLDSKMPQLCSICKVATFCGKDCARKAWKSGRHKQYCAYYKFRWHSFMHELMYVESLHSLEHLNTPSEVTEAIHPVLPNKNVDYFLAREFGLFVVHEKAGIRYPFLGDHKPSIEKFYKNLGRVRRGEWWICGDPTTFGDGVDVSKRVEVGVEELELFFILCVSMMYSDEDIAAIGRPGATNVFESLCESHPDCSRRTNDTATSARLGGIDNVKRICGGKLSMPPSIFLGIYRKFDPPCTEDWSRRHITASVRLDLYNLHRQLVEREHD